MTEDEQAHYDHLHRHLEAAKRRITDLERLVTHMTPVVKATHQFLGVWISNAAALRRLTAPSDQFIAVDMAVSRMADAIHTIY